MIPVITALAGAGATVSVDTMRHEVAEAALAAGARIVNDVSGGLADPEILRVVADCGGDVRRHALARARRPHDRLRDVRRPGRRRRRGPRRAGRSGSEAALAAGVAPERLVLDPGLGFAKHGEHNWQLLAHLDADRRRSGYPLLVGASRKSFLGTLLADADGTPRGVDGREDATTALSVLLAQVGVWGLRVHDVRSTRDALRVLAALETAREEGRERWMSSP